MMTTMMQDMSKIEKQLKSSNFITPIDIQLNGITKEETEEFCTKYGLTWGVNSRVGMVFYKDEKLVTDFKQIIK